MFSPLVGIPCAQDRQNDNYYLRNYYAKAVEAVGGVPIILPPVEQVFARGKYGSILDGIIFPGGGDIDPVYFGEEPKPGMGPICPERDDFEIAAAREFYRMKKPILAICRGMQVLNTALGGTVIQDLNTEIKGCLKHDQNAPKWYPTHTIFLNIPSKLGEIFPGSTWRVNTFHHQAVGKVAPGLVVSARARDGIIEAVESLDHPFALGVQWHPECNWDRDMGSFRLFQAFVRACQKYLGKRE